MLPQLKVYRVDYDFIISNYLNKELWKKKWNLFVYKDNVFTLNLSSIDTKNDAISFEIRYNKIEGWDGYKIITYYLNNTTIKVLKQQINGAIFQLMQKKDEDLCKETDGYKKICSMYSDEKDELRKIAENYLDENNITLDDVREAYIDNYVSNHTKCDVYKSNYLYAHKYRYLTDMFIVFTKITEDNNRYNTVVSAINDIDYINSVKSDIEEFKKYFETDDYEEDMVGNLDTI